MSELESYRILAVNREYLPLGFVSWQKAVGMVLSRDNTRVAAHYEREIESPSTSIRLPKLLVLQDVGYISERPELRDTYHRGTLLARDNYRCQYCGKKINQNSATVDHVVPKSRWNRAMGDYDQWENVVAACGPCNRKKGDRTPKEAGMELRTDPHRPDDLLLAERRFLEETIETDMELSHA